MLDDIDQQKMFDTLFLLFLGTLGGFVGGGITSCEIQRIIRDSVLVKQFIFFVIIFTTNSFVQKKSDLFTTFVRSSILFGVFILLMKNNYKSILVAITLLFINKLLLQHIDFLNKEDDEKKENDDEKKEDDDKINKLNRISKILTLVSGVIILVGFFEYMREKKLEYGSKFKLLTFLLGSNKCRSLM